MKLYRSKINFILLGILAALFIVFVVKLILDERMDTLGGWLLKIIIGLILVFCIDLFLRTRYIIKDKVLLIKSGIFSYPAIPIQSIISIEKIHSLLSSPAPSFDRLEIKYETYDSIIISPRHKKEFIKHLQSINPSITSSI
ncbi:MAG: PH domain-containing protein [Patiriisocius sp.]|uniref:PH domain-containing protein n=1 Tax=Patiriisocius sp. TaxID=2822396 RepID=UPI003EF560A9